MTRLMTRFVLISLAALCVAACGGDDEKAGRSADCPTLCTEAQAGTCTSIKGNCSAFCTALNRAAPTAGCQAKRDAYINCLNGGSNACAVNCDSSESAIEQCMGVWCATHGTDADCQTLVASF